MADKEKPKKQDEAGVVVGAVVIDGIASGLVDELPIQLAYYYDSTKNPLNAFIPGVPLCDLTQEVVDAQPKWVQKSIKGSPMYKAANASDEDEGDKE